MRGEVMKSSDDNTAGDQAPGLGDHLCLGVYLSHLEIQRTYKPHLDALGLTYPQYLVLNLLWEADHRTIGAMARALDLESSTITPVVKRLEAGGFLERRRNKSDERQVTVSLTPKGQALRKDCACVPMSLLEASGLSVAEILDLNQTLRRLHKALTQSRA